MSAQKQTNRADAVREAATGYAVVVLGILCFLLALTAVMAGVRVVVGANTPATGTMTATSSSAATSANANGNGTA